MAGFSNLAQLMGDDIVTVYVGPREKCYSVHKTLLTSQSEYFEKALNGKFKEADEQAIRLPEDSPDAFDLLIGWLYQNQIPILGYGPGPFDDFPRGIVVGATKVGYAPIQPNRGTLPTEYPPHEEISATIFPHQAAGNNLRDRFHNICTQRAYGRYSPEELRLQDYTLNHRFSDSPRPAPENVTIPDPFPVSPGHIDGIPHCSPIEPIRELEEAHQLALIRLCLFAETTCWTSLFNIAMSTYVQGESFLAPRPMPREHIELIYERAHPESPCRKFAADATISQISAAGQIDRNMDLVEQWPTFLEDIFKRLGLSQELSRIHGPKGKGPCEYHVHDAKNQPQKCSAAMSEYPNFILDTKASTKKKYTAKCPGVRRPAGMAPSRTRSEDDTTAGSSGEIRYTTYHPNIGYTTRTLGYDDTLLLPNETFSRPGDSSMDWGTGYRPPWHIGNGFSGSSHASLGIGTGGFGQPVSGFSVGHFSGSQHGVPRNTEAPMSTNLAATIASFSSFQNGGSGTGSNFLSPQEAATTASSANPSIPQTEPTISAPLSGTSTSTASPATTTAVSGSSQTGALAATPQKDGSNVTGPGNQGSNPTFGTVSPLASPFPPLTARSMNGDHIFGQSLPSSSTTANPGSLFSSAGFAAHTNASSATGFEELPPLPSSSASSTNCNEAAAKSTSRTPSVPFDMLASSSPSDGSSAGWMSHRAVNTSRWDKSSPNSLFGSRNESNLPPSSGSSTAAAMPSSRTLFGSAPTNLFGTRKESNIPQFYGSYISAPPNSGSLFASAPISSFGLGNNPNVPPSVSAATAALSNGESLFGSTSGPSNVSVPGNSAPPSLFGLSSGDSSSSVPANPPPSNLFGLSSGASNGSLPK